MSVLYLKGVFYMIKPIKQYNAEYMNDNNGKITTEQEVYMCEYVDALVKRPLKEDEMLEMDFEFGF